MITLNFHWAWLPIVIFIIMGVVSYYYYSKDDRLGLNTAVGVIILIICLLFAAVIGGIFIW